MFPRRVLLTIVYVAVAFGGALFGTAGTFDWWRAWVLVGVIVVATLAIMLGVLRHRPALLKERMKGIFQKGQPWIDRLVVLLFVLSFGAMLIFTAHDVFDYHLLPEPAIAISSLGLALVAAAYWFVALAFQANDFAVPVVKHQKERQHVVVDTGPYAVVRHPMYVGVILMLVGAPLWLESYAGALVALVPIAMLMLRILVEERFLRRELPGYEAYTERVRYRLLPHVW